VFQASLSSLSTSSAFAANTANTSDSTVFTASAASGAVPGRYAITVSALASSQQLLSNAFVGGTTAVVGTGTLNVKLGSSSFNLTLDSHEQHRGGCRRGDQFRADNPGITATVIQGTDGAHLLLSSNQTGAANAIEVTETDAGAGLAALTYATGNTANYTQNAAAQDAAFSVAGVAYTSASNSVNDALSGVTLTLTGVSTGAGATLTVANDTTTVTTNIQAFIAAYNTLQSSVASLGSYDAASGSAGPMLGDPLLTGVQSQIRHVLQTVNGSATYSTLASVGITTQKDGTLAADPARLQAALTGNFSAVSKLFSGDGGVASQLDKLLTQQLGGGGTIDTRSQTLVKQNKALSDQTTALNKQMDAMTQQPDAAVLGAERAAVIAPDDLGLPHAGDQQPAHGAGQGERLIAIAPCVAGRALLKLSVRKPLTAPWVGPGAALGEWLRTKCEARGLPERVRARRRGER
jgi:flagellar hook-associated protein 2